MHHAPVGNLKTLVLCWLVMLSSVLILLALVAPNAIYAALGFAALSIVLIPMLLQKRLDWFSPWTLVVLTVFLGCTCEAICLTFNWPNPAKIQDFFTLGRGPREFIRPGLIMLSGLAAMTIGYHSLRKTKRRLTPVLGRLSVVRLYGLLIFLFLCSALASYQYIQNTGGFTSGVLSGKRTTIFDLDIQGDKEFNQFGVLRQLAELSAYGYLLLLAYILSQRRELSGGKIGILVLFFLLACVVPFYSSCRGPIVWLFIGSAAIVWYLKRHLATRAILAIGVLGLAALMFTSLIRGRENVKSSFEAPLSVETFIDHIVMNSIYAGISKTTQIIHAVPDRLDFQYGRTIAVWLVAPVPRSMWPGKPLIQSGPIIGVHVFGTRVSGVPPGMVAELYWNFHVPGVIIGCLAMGWMLRLIGDSTAPLAGERSLGVLIYVLGPMRLGFDLLSHSIGFALFSMAVNMCVATVLLIVIHDRKPRTIAHRRRVSGMHQAAWPLRSRRGKRSGGLASPAATSQICGNRCVEVSGRRS